MLRILIALIAVSYTHLDVYKRQGLTGADGGALHTLCDVSIRVQAREVYRIQEYHLPVYHCLCAMLELEFFGAQA